MNADKIRKITAKARREASEQEQQRMKLELAERDKYHDQCVVKYFKNAVAWIDKQIRAIATKGEKEFFYRTGIGPVEVFLCLEVIGQDIASHYREEGYKVTFESHTPIAGADPDSGEGGHACGPTIYYLTIEW